MRPGPAELALVGAAVAALRRGPGPAGCPGAAAVRTADGRVVTGLGLGTLCPEPVAIGAALALGATPLALAAVRHVDGDSTVVTTPCPTCRRVLLAHAPGLRVLHLDGGLQVCVVADLPG